MSECYHPKSRNRQRCSRRAECQATITSGTASRDGNTDRHVVAVSTATNRGSIDTSDHVNRVAAGICLNEGGRNRTSEAAVGRVTGSISQAATENRALRTAPLRLMVSLPLSAEVKLEETDPALKWTDRFLAHEQKKARERSLHRWCHFQRWLEQSQRKCLVAAPSKRMLSA